jgi:copper chaperone CopZ
MTTTTRLQLQVPAMVDQPAVGTSCCVTSAEALVAQELWMLPGVADAEIDPLTGSVVVDYDPAALQPDEIAAALREIGYPPAD